MTDDLITGNDLIDREHSELFKNINHLMEACSRGSGRKEAEKTMEFLEQYVKKHFSDEENLQRRYGYPDLENHHRYHETYKQIVSRLKKELEENGPTISFLGKINRSIADWLTSHIRNEDQKVAAHIRKVQSQRQNDKY